jgi:hypothetical protein
MRIVGFKLVRIQSYILFKKVIWDNLTGQHLIMQEIADIKIPNIQYFGEDELQCLGLMLDKYA